MADRGISTTWETILLITHPRYFHYIFNPVSFYLCYADAHALGCVVAEVNNTFGDRHLYITDQLCRTGTQWRTTCPVRKTFHVSPFNRVEGRYAFTVERDQGRLAVGVDLWVDDQLHLRAELCGTSVPVTTRALLSAWVRHPLRPVLTTPRILKQAATLYIQKKLTVHKRTEPEDVMTIIKREPSLLEKGCQRNVTDIFSKIEHGALWLHRPDGRIDRFGDQAETSPVELYLHRYAFFRKLVFRSDVGLGEAFVEGDIT